MTAVVVALWIGWLFWARIEQNREGEKMRRQRELARGEFQSPYVTGFGANVQLGKS